MAITISNWGSDWSTMSWLDSQTGCKGDCDNNPLDFYSNIRVQLGNDTNAQSFL